MKGRIKQHLVNIQYLMYKEGHFDKILSDVTLCCSSAFRFGLIIRFGLIQSCSGMSASQVICESSAGSQNVTRVNACVNQEHNVDFA